MYNISVAVVGSDFGINVGYISRVMKNFGLKSLYLIDSNFNIQDSLIFSSHGADIIKKAKTTNWKTMAKNFDLIIGTSAIHSDNVNNISRTTISLKELNRKLTQFSGNICIVLGRDTTGLTNNELRLCDLIVTIDTGTNYQTLNISHALSIILYELSIPNNVVHKQLASNFHKELFITYCLKLAKELNFPEYRIVLLDKAFKQILGRSLPTKRELSIITGLIRKGLSALIK